MKPKERLTAICTESLQSKALSDSYSKRLKDELREIDAQNEFEYFLDLHDKKVRYAINENNLLVPWLLGIVEEFKVDEEPIFTYGEFPDIDIDYIDVIRDYLKNDWALKEFGADRVCNIGNYSTFGIKSAFTDMARVHSKSHSEIKALTTKLGLKDDEGKSLTYDKALEMFPELKEYCDNNPDVARSVKKLLHRNRGMSKHAGGLIIANGPIDKFIPLVKNAKDDTVSSGWVEGLHAQDLGPVGLIKFDLLVISDLERIAMASSFAKRRHGLESMCALPGQGDWSDRHYKNDEDALAMARKGDLVGVFQFDSMQIRAMVRRGGVDSFDDLVAYNALYRPGPLGMKMHERYIERKREREPYEIHPVMEPYLNKTYGVLIYQEQVMQVLNAVGDIPLKDCYILIKAIAKKKHKFFGPYMKQFLEVGKERLGWTDAQILNLWKQIESFAEYGFNKTIDQDTIIHTASGPQKVCDVAPGDKVSSVNDQGETVFTEVVALHDHGVLPGYEVIFDDGYKVVCTLDHKFLTYEGQKPLHEIFDRGLPVLADGGYGKCKEKWLDRQMRDDVSHFEGHGTASAGMFPVHGIKERECGFSYGEVEHRESIAGSQGDYICGGKENCVSTGHSGGKGDMLAEMARGKPGKICCMYSGSTIESEAVQERGLAQEPIGLAGGNHTVIEGTATRGFGEGEYLDRSGWSSPLCRFVACEMGPSDGELYGEGWSVEGRGFKSEALSNTDFDGMFCFCGTNEAGLVDHTPEYAPISDTGRLVSRKVIRVMPVGLRQMYDLEVANPTHNFLLPNGIVTSNSHATAYVYIASRCLYLKAHYPLEFYAATLRCEGVTEKMKEYKTEAEQHNVVVHPVLLNKSKSNFDIVDDEICFGFSNVKGIGEAVAERIVAGQPYAGFQDFLERFGTDSKVVQALIALRVFKDADPVTLCKYYEFFKDKTKKRGDRKKRFKKTIEKLYERLRFLLGPAEEEHAEFKEEYFKKWQNVFNVDEMIDVEEEVEETLFSSIDGVEPTIIKKTLVTQQPFNRWKELKKTWNAYQRATKGDEVKTVAEKENSLSLANFNPDEYSLDDELIKLLRDVKDCERTFYGFQWRTRLEESPDYAGGHTFERFKTLIESEGCGLFSVEVEIEDVQKRTSKKNKNFTYHQLTASDANGEVGYITVWNEDWERWEPEMKKGNLVKIKIMPPSPPHKTYTFESPPRHMRHKVPKDKRADQRLVVMDPPVQKEEHFSLTDDEIMAQLENCKVEEQ